MRVWITKTQPPRPDGLSRLISWGYKPICSPLLHLATAQICPTPPARDVTDLIFTSQNAVRYFSQYSDHRNTRIIAVGEMTAACARDHGFTDIICLDGTAQHIIDYITALNDQSRSYYHGCGKDHRGDIVEHLNKAGIKAVRQILYQTYAPQVNRSVMAEYILLYSPKAAQILAQSPPQNRAHIISISAATDDALGEMPTLSRQTAASPNENSMFDLLPRAHQR